MQMKQAVSQADESLARLRGSGLSQVSILTRPPLFCHHLMYMNQPSFDPGLTQKFTSPVRRTINKDGSFNVRRHGTTWRDYHPYLHLVSLSWASFFLVLLAGYVLANVVFAVAYFLLGPDALAGADRGGGWTRFIDDFFFSTHTLSTVGYGNISPNGMAAGAISAFEAWLGVLAFAVAAGLLYGRVSRPSARFGFSDRALIAPYQDGQSLQFRVVNRRANSLMDLEARVMLMTVETDSGLPVRRYHLLKLEREQVMFLALTWTVVHPIDEQSPFYGKTAADLDRLQAELLILIKAYDDSFSQTVLARHSYRHDEMQWGARFAPAFSVDAHGDLVLELRKVSALAQ
jgi:inward rectifier potassium channel